MSDPIFTPGPWAASMGNPIEDHRFYVAAKRDTKSGMSFYDDHIAWVSGEANAYLISAAPELLDALRQCVKELKLANLTTDGLQKTWTPQAITIELAEVIIAHAEGRA